MTPLTADIPDSTSLKTREIEAFETFLSGLPIRNPRELILINPQLVPEEYFDPVVAKNQGYYAFPPIGLLYIAAVAKKLNPHIKIDIIDLNYEILRHAHDQNFSYKIWEERLEKKIKVCEAPHLGITYMFGATKPVFLKIAAWLRQKFPKVPILAGGVQATYDFAEILENNYADIVFRREGEKQYESFMTSCANPSRSEIPWGAAFQISGKVHELGEAAGDPVVDWDIRSFYSNLEIEKYYRVGSLAAFSRFNGEDKSFATVLSNRGCRARCTFCTVRNFNGFGVRGRAIQSVIDEIKFLVEEKGVRQIDWLDDDLLWDPERTVALFKGLAEQIPQLEWICNNGLIAAAITDEIMYWMVKSGLKAFKIGIESGNDEMLTKIKKPTTKPKLRAKRELFKQYPEVFVSANFIVGFPKETFSQMMDTFNFANELEWDWSSFYICQPLKGTEMFSAFTELGDERTEVESYDKTLNPGRAAARGEFGYQFKEGTEKIRTGKEVFNLRADLVPSQDQIKEIWFTFNLVTNFINNINFTARGSAPKIVKWLESIAHAYPYDASMVAGLARGYRLAGDKEKFESQQKKFQSILSESYYWRRRVEEFPELLEFAESALPAGR